MNILKLTESRLFGRNGCQVPVGKGICGERRKLDIINEFRMLYQKKMDEIEVAGGGDCLMEKLKLQEEWIDNLTEQNEMLVKVVEELEHEATERVHILEEKLQRSAQCICEVMNKYRQYDVSDDVLAEPLEKVFRLENDRKNLLEFLRRIREEKKWCTDGLKFFEISYDDLFGNEFTEPLQDGERYLLSDIAKGEEKRKHLESTVIDLRQKVEHLNSFGNVEFMAKELKCKQEECESLKQEMVDMRQALTEEVATKHDTILQLKKECQQLEDRCIQADKQTAFRDDIIKELRKEAKQLKQQLTQDEIIKLNDTVDELQQNLHKSRKLQEEEEKASCKEICRLKSIIEELQNTLQLQEKEEQASCREICRLKSIINDLEKKVTTRIKKQKDSDDGKTSCEDICKLRSIIDTLQGKIKMCACHQENEAKEKESQILKLRKTLENLDVHLMEANNQIRDKEAEIASLYKTIETMNSHLHETDYNMKVKENEIHKLIETVKTLEDNKTSLEGRLKVCKICKRRSNVHFINSAEAQANFDEDSDQQQEHYMELLRQRDEIIKVQTNTLKVLQQEIDSLKERGLEKEKYSCEVQLLKNRIAELEDELKNSEGKCGNLQTAIDLYLNSINILEATEAKCNIEIAQQKATISNLQKALIAVKQELESVKQKTSENDLEELKMINNFTNVICLKDVEREELEEYMEYISDGYENLQTFNLELELEHCDSLQDIDMLENQLYKYQTLLKCEEDNVKQCKSQVKKLVKQKKCYEEVIGYFKQEMTLMSEQLINLQELLTLSYSSVQEENCRLNKAFVNVQTVNSQLAQQLCAAEQKIQLENQMNQLNETKIIELEKLVSEKEIDLNRHDKAIMNIRESLKNSLKQNEELHETIISLNSTIAQLQNAIKKYENDNSRSKESATNCQTQINMCKQKLEELKLELEKKSTELCKLEVAYNRQNRNLRTAKVELQEMKDKDKEKQCNLRCIVQEVEEKFRKSEEKYNELMEDYGKLEDQMSVMARKEALKDVEIQKYRKIIVDLKKTLIDLNTNLIKRNIIKSDDEKSTCDCLAESDKAEIPNCPCEVEYYQRIVEDLKKSVAELRQKLSDYEKLNEDLENKCKCSEARLQEMSKSQAERDKECEELRRQLAEKLNKAKLEETQYTQIAGQFEKELSKLRQELEIRTKQLDDVKRSAQQISSCRCVQLVCAQEECNNLKEELNKLLKKHCALNAENQRLQQQSAKIQALEENRQLLNGQLEQYLADLQALQSEKESLVHKNHDLMKELRTVQNSSNKQQRYANDSLKSLENELGDLKNSRDDICLESKNIITYFRAWLDEQKKINEYLSNKEKDYRATIKKLQQQNEVLQFQVSSKTPQYYCTRPINTSPLPTCQSPWSLGSQGTASFHEESPSGSPCPMNEDCDWYAANFRSYSEDDEEEEDWVSKVENLAEQVRKTNKMWKNRLCEAECSEAHVSKDKETKK